MALRRVIKWPFERPKIAPGLRSQVRLFKNFSVEADKIEARRTVDLWLKGSGAAEERMVRSIVFAFCRDGKYFDAEQALKIAESHGRCVIKNCKTMLPLFWYYAREGKKGDAEAMMKIVLERKLKIHVDVFEAMTKLQGSVEALVRYLDDNNFEWTPHYLGNIFGIAVRHYRGEVEPIRKKLAELGMDMPFSVYLHLMARALRAGDLEEFGIVMKKVLSDKTIIRNPHFYRILLDLLARARDKEGAEAAFRAMLDDGFLPGRTEMTKIALVHGATGDIEGFRKAVKLWLEVPRKPHIFDCENLAKYALVLGDTDSIETIWRQTRIEELWVSSNLMAAVVRAFGRDGRLEDAEKVFEEAKLRDIYLVERVYAAMVDVYGRNHEIRKAYAVFRACPDKYWSRRKEVVEHMIKAYARNGLPQEAGLLFENYAAGIHNPETGLYKTQIQMVLAHGLAGDYGTARKLFDEMKDRVKGVVAQLYADMITVCGVCGETDEIWNVFSDFVGRKRRHPSPWVFSRVIKAYGRNGLVDDALAAYEEMSRFGLLPNGPVYDAVIGAHATTHDYESATDVLRDMVAREIRPTGCTFREMLTPALEAGDVATAFRLMDALLRIQPKPGRGVYELVIRKARETHSLQEIVQRFLAIRRNGAKTDDETIDRIISRTWESERRAAQNMFRASYRQSGMLLEDGKDAGGDY